MKKKFCISDIYSGGKKNPDLQLFDQKENKRELNGQTNHEKQLIVPEIQYV